MPLFFIVDDLAVARRNNDFKLDLTNGCVLKSEREQPSLNCFANELMGLQVSNSS